MLNVIVSTVESKLEFALHKNSLGRQLFDQIVKTLGIREVWYFGIQYTDKDNNLCWLKLDKKVTSHDLGKEKPPMFYFRVKFYPEDVVEELIEDLTREFFYLQVKSSILKGEIYCPAETAVLLSSYVCHVRIGPHSLEAEKSIPDATRLLPASVIDSHDLTNEEWHEKIINCYSQHKSLTKEEAIIEYLKLCQDLEMYGVTYYQIKNKKGTKLWLGIDSMGLSIYEYEDKLTPKIGFPWDEVKKVSFKSKKFILLPTDKTAKEWHFMVERVRFNRQILQLSIGNHELYIRRRKADSIEVQQMKTKAQELRESKSADRKRLNEERYAREEMERRVKEIESEAIRRQEDYEEAIRMAKEYERQLEEVQKELQKEREARILLASTQEQLRKINQQLEERKAVTATAEDKVRLENEHKHLQALISQQTEQIEAQSRMNAKRSMELMSIKKKVTIPLLLPNDVKITNKDGYISEDDISSSNSSISDLDIGGSVNFTKSFINIDALHPTHKKSHIPQPANDQSNEDFRSQMHDLLSPNTPPPDYGKKNSSNDSVDFNGAEKEHDDRALEVLDTINRKEEDRETEYNKNEALSKKMKDLRSDLQEKRNVSKLKDMDHKYDDIQKKGQDKFKTLRQIRQGNTKKRVDQFESL